MAGMQTNNVLDWNLLNALGHYPERGEEVYWAGAPALTPKYLGVNFFPGAPHLWGIYYLFILNLFKSAYETRDFWLLGIAMGILLIFQIIPGANNYLRMRRTLYVVTNKRIVLRLWRNFRQSIHVLYYTDFQSTAFQAFESNAQKGTVYLYTTKDVGFWTYDLESGDRRDHPSLEGIVEPEKMARQIETFRKAIISH